jgi:hypothetical protein
MRLRLSAAAGFAMGGQASVALIDGTQLKVYPGPLYGITDTHQGAARRRPGRVPEDHERKGGR